MWHTRTYFHSLINVCDRFLERTKLSRSGAWPGRELFISRIGWGAHGGANDLVPLLPVSLCEPDKAIRVALGERHVEKCAMRKTLSGGFWTVSLTRRAMLHLQSECTKRSGKYSKARDARLLPMLSCVD